MKVNIKDKRDKIGEMSASGELEMGHIAEMVTESTKLADFGFSPDLVSRATALASANSDESPEFPVVRVEAGWSGSNRLWTGEMIDNIIAQTNLLQPVGHLGHIPDRDASTSFPEPQTTWFGAVGKTEPSKQPDRLGEMVRVAYFGGYNLPGAKVRMYIKSKAVRGISWWGDGEQRPVRGRGVEVTSFTLKALDWARKLAEGMPTSSVVAITGEMKEGGMDKELSQVTPAEFKTENPNGYEVLKIEVGKEYEVKIGEMTTQIEGLTKQKTLVERIATLLGVEDLEGLYGEIEGLKTRVGDRAKVSVRSAIDKLLAEKVPDDEKRSLVDRLLLQPIAEMETKAAVLKDDDAVVKMVGEMVDAAFNSDEEIKKQIGEMTPASVRRTDKTEGGSGGNNPYIQNRERVAMGG